MKGFIAYRFTPVNQTASPFCYAPSIPTKGEKKRAPSLLRPEI